MKYKFIFKLCAAFAIASGGVASSQAQIRITEVTPWGSSTTNPNIPYATDWFELTNFGASAVTITGWKMDDNSNSFASSVALTGITSIAPGESVIFTENPATSSFLNTWFGGSPPVGLQIGNYTGNGVGLSQTSDAVNIYDAGGTLMANVSFGASDSTSPFQTFDNAAGLNNTTISALSVVGTNGAFVAANDSQEIGSPGRISAVPEPASSVLASFGLLLGILQCFRRRHA
jgi:hypothetical protein